LVNIPIVIISSCYWSAESTVRTWKRRKEIPEECFTTIGSTIFVKVDEIKEWMMKQPA